MQIANIQIESLRRFYLATINKAFSKECNSIDITPDTEWETEAIMNTENNTFRYIKIHNISKDCGFLEMTITSILLTGECIRYLSDLHIDSLHQLTMWLVRNKYIINPQPGGVLNYKIEAIDNQGRSQIYGPFRYRNQYDAWNYLRRTANQTEGTLMVKVETGIPTNSSEYDMNEYWLPVRYGNLGEEWNDPEEKIITPTTLQQKIEFEWDKIKQNYPNVTKEGFLDWIVTKSPKKLSRTEEVNWQFRYRKTIHTDVIHSFTWESQNYEIVAFTIQHIYCDTQWVEFFVQKENRDEFENFITLLGYQYGKTNRMD